MNTRREVVPALCFDGKTFFLKRHVEQSSDQRVAQPASRHDLCQALYNHRCRSSEEIHPSNKWRVRRNHYDVPR